MADFTLLIDAPPIPSGWLQLDAPEGVTVTHPPMIFTRSGDPLAAVEITIHISLSSGVLIPAVAAWLCKRLLNKRFDLNPRIDGKTLPQNEADAAKLITDAIREEKESADDGRKAPKERK